MKHALVFAALAALAVELCLPAAAAFNYSQTFTNRTNQAASGFRWWFSPDATVSGVGSNVFSSSTVTHHPNAIYGYPSAVDVWHSNGNVNVGSSATMWATVSGTSTMFRPEWTNNLGVSIGSAYLPCSFGGSTLVQGAMYVWDLRIDNPSDSLVMQIDNLEYSLSTLNLAGPSLVSFAGPWTLVEPTVVVNPGEVYTFQVTSTTEELPIVQCDLSYDGVPDSDSSMRFQAPEPAVLGLLVVGAVALLRRR